MKRAVAILMTLAGAWQASLSAATLEVPAQYATVQDAIDAAGLGDTVKIAPGEYTGNLVLKPGISLEGESSGEVTVRGDTAKAAVLEVSGCATGSVRGITIEPVPGTKGAAPLCRVTGSDIVFDSCTLRGGPADGLVISGSGKPTIQACEVSGNGGAGLRITGADAAPIVRGTRAVDNESDGASFESGAKADVKDGEFSRNGGNGISLRGMGTGGDFYGTVCNENKGSGACLSQGAEINLRGNICDRNALCGVQIDDDAGETQVVANKMRDNRRYGIRFADQVSIFAAHNDFTHNNEISPGEIANLMSRGTWDDLETIAARLRKEKSLMLSGEWQLAEFYSDVTRNCRRMKPAREQRFMECMDQWKAAKPDSITWRIALTTAYKEFAWRERGGGYANTVTPEGLEGFHRYSRLAAGMALEAEKMPEAKSDPHVYDLLCDLALFSNSREAFEVMPYSKGLHLFPDYEPLYQTRAFSLLPRWGGRPREVVRLAQHAAEMSRATYGEGLYMRIALQTVTNEGEDVYFSTYDFSWPRIRQGYYDWFQRFPSNSGHLASPMARMACLYDDKEAALFGFGKMTGAPDADTLEDWGGQAPFDQWKRWAAGQGPAPARLPRK